MSVRLVFIYSSSFKKDLCGKHSKKKEATPKTSENNCAQLLRILVIIKLIAMPKTSITNGEYHLITIKDSINAHKPNNLPAKIRYTSFVSKKVPIAHPCCWA